MRQADLEEADFGYSTCIRVRNRSSMCIQKLFRNSLVWQIGGMWTLHVRTELVCSAHVGIEYTKLHVRELSKLDTLPSLMFASEAAGCSQLCAQDIMTSVNRVSMDMMPD